MAEKIKRVPWHEYVLTELRQFAAWFKERPPSWKEIESLEYLRYAIERTTTPGKHAGEVYTVICETSATLVSSHADLASKLDEVAQALCAEQRCTNCYGWHDYGKECQNCTTQARASLPETQDREGLC